MPKILVVDDADTIRSDLSNDLSNHGYETVTASNGQEALEVLKVEPDVKLVLTDLNMPVMNGIDLLEKIRHELDKPEMKVLMMSTETNSVMRKRGKELQVSGWILKPIRSEALLAVTAKLMKS